MFFSIVPCKFHNFFYSQCIFVPCVGFFFTLFILLYDHYSFCLVSLTSLSTNFYQLVCALPFILSSFLKSLIIFAIGIFFSHFLISISAHICRAIFFAVRGQGTSNKNNSFKLLKWRCKI